MGTRCSPHVKNQWGGGKNTPKENLQYFGRMTSDFDEIFKVYSQMNLAYNHIKIFDIWYLWPHKWRSSQSHTWIKITWPVLPIRSSQKSIADIITELPGLGDLENPGQLPVQEVLEGSDDCVL